MCLMHHLRRLRRGGGLGGGRALRHGLGGGRLGSARRVSRRVVGRRPSGVGEGAKLGEQRVRKAGCDWFDF